MTKQTFGVVVTSRSFFPSHLVKTARRQIFEQLDRLGYGAVAVSEEDTQYGAVVSYQEAKVCAELFRRHAEEISGIICVLPNFGEELGVTEAIELTGLDVPVLVQACNDDFEKLDLANRRDAFCGKISLCNNLYQRGIPFTNTTSHTCDIDSDEFSTDLQRFAAVCRVVNGLRGSRIAMLGARPIAFNTVRYSEKILQRHRISVQTVDMSEVIFKARNYSDDTKVASKKLEISAYGQVPPMVSDELMTRQAKLCLAIEETVEDLQCDASTVQCWDSVENNYGCATCLAMSMMGEKGKPSACESDVTGAVSMLAAYLAAQQPPALMDWNNNIGSQKNQCISLHCSNFPKSFFQTQHMEIGSLDVLGSTLGEGNCFGACKGQVGAGGMTFLRISTDDVQGKMKMYVGEGRFIDEELPTKGGVANCYVDDLQSLLKYICKNGFEHHVCFVRGYVADILEEAFSTYMHVDVYRHPSGSLAVRDCMQAGQTI